ncbi:hypothetical protein BGX26_012525 [Mortierella sp. AD094]|nr:hypothetical protein BGX26_012525 [Mortierella sp. AD094]
MTMDAATSSHGLLLLRISDVDAPLGDAFHAIKRALALVHRLTIALSVTQSGSVSVSVDSNNGTIPPSTITSPQSLSFHNVQRILSALYVSFTKQTVALKRPLAELDIVFRDSCGYEIGVGSQDTIPFDVLLGMPDVTESLEELNRRRTKHGQKSLPIFTLDLTPEVGVHTHLVEAIDSVLPHAEVQEGEYRDVALGGTFDHLHAGHKILLSMTAWVTSHRVVCGVTDDSMLKTKKFKEYMEPLHKRVEDVEKFLRTFKRDLIYEVVPIHDIYGPTITDDKLQALMVSKETLKGGDAVNEERGKRNLPPLNIEVINVISPTETHVDEVSLKISSTFIRQYLSEQDNPVKVN